MKIQTISKFALTLGMLLSANVYAQQLSLANQLRVHYGERAIISEDWIQRAMDNRNSRVHGSYSEFVLALDQTIDDRSSSLHEFVGYSDEYAEKKVFETDFRRAVINAVTETKSRLGPTGVTVLVLGGSPRGFGAGYDIIDELKKTGQIKDVVVSGMVSDQAVKLHLDGVKQGYNVISPLQDHMLVMNTYTEGGNQTWELKENKLSESKTISLVLRPQHDYSVLHIMEGGEQALKESMELLVETARSEASGWKIKPEMHLYVGYRQGKVAKMSGYKAATQMVRTLLQFPQMRPESLTVTAQFAGEANPTSINKLAQKAAPKGFYNNPDFLLSIDQKAQISAEETAARLTKFQDAMGKTLPLLHGQLREVGARLDAYTAKIHSWIDQPSHPVNASSDSLQGALKQADINMSLKSQFSTIANQVVAKIMASPNIITGDSRARRAVESAKGAGQTVRIEDVVKKSKRSK